MLATLIDTVNLFSFGVCPRAPKGCDLSAGQKVGIPAKANLIPNGKRRLRT